MCGMKRSCVWKSRHGITVYNMYVHIYWVRNTTINRWYHYVIRFWYLWMEPRLALTILRCVIPVVLSQILQCIICTYLHIYSVRNTTINRWYHYVIRFWYLWMEPRLALTILRCVIPVVLSQILQCIICMYLHIYSVRNTTINRWYHYIIRFWYLWMEPRLALT